RLLGITCDPGEPFDGILADLLYNERDLINFHFGDLKSLTYEGGNISVLFLDVMKERELSQRVMEQFCPQLRADAVIIHQDYFHPAHPWIPVVMARNEHLFEYVGRPQTDEFINTAVFRLKAPVEALTKANWSLELNREDVIEAMNTALRIHSDPVEQFNMLGTLCAIEGSFDGDPPKMLAKFNALLDERGLTDLANSPAQKRHFERIKSSVRVFANGRKQL
ncbi:hypothetical protein, partial [Hyphomonas sp.]|uniref:hypothetical protein n=1 Tax=Hyphomonas sp. TaxID=87 RepID=UPI00324300CD